MLATKISTHVTDGLNLLLQQYKGHKVLEGMLTAILQNVQKIEDALYAMDAGRQIWDGTKTPAVGAQLDDIGDIVGLKRNGLDDMTYVVLLFGTIAENNSDSTTDALLNIVQSVFEAANVFIAGPSSTMGATSPAYLEFSVGSPQIPTALYAVVQQIILNSIGAGIGLAYLSTHVATGAFAMSGVQPWTRQAPPTFTPDAGHPWPFGFGELGNPYVGGPLAEIIYSATDQ